MLVTVTDEEKTRILGWATRGETGLIEEELEPIAIREGITEAEALVEASTYPSGATIIHYAVQSGAQATISWLCEAEIFAGGPGAQRKLLNMKTYLGDNPIMWAVQYQKPNIVRELAARGCEVNTTNKAGMTPVLLAYQQNDLNILATLLDCGGLVQASSPNSGGETLLHAATRDGNIAAVKLLLDRGMDINTVNNVGLAPLHIAADAQNDVMSDFFMDRGADKEIRDKKGLSPVHIARRKYKEKLEESGLLRNSYYPPEPPWIARLMFIRKDPVSFYHNRWGGRFSG